MNFSLVLASRGRPGPLEELFLSVERTAADLGQLEVLVGLDADDDATLAALPSLARPWVTFHVRVRGNNLARDYHNWLYPLTRGKYLFILNDDCVLTSSRWDERAAAALNVFTRAVPHVYGRTSPTGAQGYSEFPIVGRAGVEALGWLMSPKFAGWGADHYLWSVYLGAGRLIDLRSVVVVDHLRLMDATRERVASLSVARPTMMGAGDEARKITGGAWLL